MSLSKIQFAVLTLLAASAAGIGVGWLARSAPNREPLAIQPPAAPPTAETNEGLRQEIAALRDELRELKKQPSEAAKPDAEKTETISYQGKPKGYWLAALRDRDADFRLKAVPALASIARMDRTVMSALLGGLQDDSEAVRGSIAYALPDLAPVRQDAVPALVRAELEARDLLPLLKQIDAPGQITLAAALDSLKDKRAGVRRAAAFIVCDLDKTKRERALDVLVEVLRDMEKYQLNSDVGYWIRAQDAARILTEMGVKAQKAAPSLVKAIKHLAAKLPVLSRSDAEHLQPFLSALQQVDAEGTAIPLLAQMLSDENGCVRYAAALALHHLGPKAQAALPALIAFIGQKEQCWSQEEGIQTVGTLGPAAKTAVPVLLAIVRKGKSTEELQASLYAAAVAALLKIDPTALNSKEPSLVEPGKPTKKTKSREKEPAHRGSSGA